MAKIELLKADAFHQPNIVDTMVGEGKERKSLIMLINQELFLVE